VGKPAWPSPASLGVSALGQTRLACHSERSEGLIGLHDGNTELYRKAHTTISDWLKQYPLKTNKWGPFFEDVGNWSDSEINAGTLAWYMLEHPDWDPNWRTDVRGIQDWVLKTLGIDYWKRYGPTIIGEQTVYKIQGQSHTSRHASVELRYAEQSGDTSRKKEANDIHMPENRVSTQAGCISDFRRLRSRSPAPGFEA
jgi:hypothetical protein